MRRNLVFLFLYHTVYFSFSLLDSDDGCWKRVGTVSNQDQFLVLLVSAQQHRIVCHRFLVPAAEQMLKK